MTPPASGPIFTIGHSTRTLAEFVALLRQVDVTQLVDVRSIPRSRAMPQFNGEGRRWSDIPQPNGGVLRAIKAPGEYRPPSLL